MSAYQLVNVGVCYLLHLGACELISPLASWQWPTFFIATFITAEATGDGKSSQQRVVEVRTLHRPTEPIWHFAHQFMWHPPFAAIWANLPTALTNNWDDSAGNLDTETIRTLTSSNLSPSPASWRLASRDIFMTIPARSQPATVLQCTICGFSANVRCLAHVFSGGQHRVCLCTTSKVGNVKKAMDREKKRQS